MKNFLRVIVALFLTSFLGLFLNACGGGGGSTPPPQPPLIQALLFSFPTGSAPPSNFENALASVTDSVSGANITTATVTMNGVPLTYNAAPTRQEYEGKLVIKPGDPVTLVVTVGGNTFTASGTQFTSYPTISVPVSGDIWISSSPNTVTWSGGAPLTNNAVYLLGVLDAADPNGGTAYFAAQGTDVNSFSIPAFSLTAGSQSRVVIVGIMTPVFIPNAATNSVLLFGGFNYVPVTVY